MTRFRVALAGAVALLAATVATTGAVVGVTITSAPQPRRHPDRMVT